MQAQNASEKHILKIAFAICMVFLCSCRSVHLEKSEADSESSTINIVIWEF